MPRSIAIAVFAAALFGSFSAEAVTISHLTEQQVRNVCGGDLQSGHGAMGCEKKCGASYCAYECDANKNCTGEVVVQKVIKVTPPAQSTGKAPGSGGSVAQP
jgi:hypothetical protein